MTLLLAWIALSARRDGLTRTITAAKGSARSTATVRALGRRIRTPRR